MVGIGNISILPTPPEYWVRIYVRHTADKTRGGGTFCPRVSFFYLFRGSHGRAYEYIFLKIKSKKLRPKTYGIKFSKIILLYSVKPSRYYNFSYSLGRHMDYKSIFPKKLANLYPIWIYINCTKFPIGNGITETIPSTQ